MVVFHLASPMHFTMVAMPQLIDAAEEGMLDLQHRRDLPDRV
jgi:hypothetical protein